jgi:hypothetical protein
MPRMVSEYYQVCPYSAKITLLKVHLAGQYAPKLALSSGSHKSNDSLFPPTPPMSSRPVEAEPLQMSFARPVNVPIAANSHAAFPDLSQPTTTSGQVQAQHSTGYQYQVQSGATPNDMMTFQFDPDLRVVTNEPPSSNANSCLKNWFKVGLGVCLVITVIIVIRTF